MLYKEAARLLEEKQVSFLMLKGTEITTASGQGIRPIMERLRLDENCFVGAVVADKIIGKAAALMLVLGGVQGVYGKLMSKPALEILTAAEIPCGYGKLVDYIVNRTGDGMCPLEASVQSKGITPQEARGILEAVIAQLMAAKK